MYYPSTSIQSLSFGLFQSDAYYIPKAYKISKSDFYLEESEAFFSKRFTKESYHVAGKAVSIPPTLKNQLTGLMEKIPSKILTYELPKLNEPGNREECTYFIEIELINGTIISFVVNEYEPNHLKLPSDILAFKDQIKSLLPELDKYFPYTSTF